MLRLRGIETDKLRHRINLNHGGCGFHKLRVIILIKQHLITLIMCLGEHLTVMVFVKAVEHDAQSQNTSECKST